MTSWIIRFSQAWKVFGYIRDANACFLEPCDIKHRGGEVASSCQGFRGNVAGLVGVTFVSSAVCTIHRLVNPFSRVIEP